MLSVCEGGTCTYLQQIPFRGCQPGFETIEPMVCPDTTKARFSLVSFPFSAKDIPTIDIQGLANNVFGLGGREKYCRRRNFARMTHASVRHSEPHLAFLLCRRKAKLAGVQGVDAIPHLG